MARTKALPRHRATKDTPDGSLFSAIISRVKQSGDFSNVEPILDFCRPCVHETDIEHKMILNPDEYEFTPIITFGTNEGIYLNCFLVWKFNEHGFHSVCIGSMKTLHTDRNACRIMGELCGALIYHAQQYVAGHSSSTQGPHLAKATAGLR